MTIDQIVEVLRALGVQVTKVTGDRVVAPCPFAPTRHKGGADRHPSFGVVVGDSAGFNCRSCNQKGNMSRLIWQLEQQAGSPNLRARNALYGVWGKPTEEPRLQYRPGGVRADTQSISPVTAADWDAELGGPARRSKPKEPFRPVEQAELDRLSSIRPEYAERRGIDQATWDWWGFRHDERDRRIVVPVSWPDGRLMGTSGRTTWEQDWCFGCGEMLVVPAEDDAESLVKLDECPRCGRHYQKWRHTFRMPKSETLLGLSRVGYGPLVIVEGPLDATTLWARGIRASLGNPVCTFGTGVADEQIDLMVKSGRPILVVGDGDMAGRGMNEFVLDQLGKRRDMDQPFDQYGLPDGMDPGCIDDEHVGGISKALAKLSG